MRCVVCGGWHHKDVVHLDYVGHAALTDRLLDVDPLWSWEPLAFDETGLPAIERNGGMWIKLTVCGVTRLGFGDAQGKTGGDAVKETIGDALRNAAMRFGAALDLWHKGDLHADDADHAAPPEKEVKPKPRINKQQMQKATAAIIDCIESQDELGMKEVIDELDEDEQQFIWPSFDTKQKSEIKRMLHSANASTREGAAE